MSKFRFETYKPKKRIKVSREETVPFLIKIGAVFATMGGVISFVMSGAIMGIKSFFHVKQKVDSRILKRRYIEFKIKK